MKKTYTVVWHDTYKWAKVKDTYEVQANSEEEARKIVDEGGAGHISREILNLDNLKEEDFQYAEVKKVNPCPALDGDEKKLIAEFMGWKEANLPDYYDNEFQDHPNDDEIVHISTLEYDDNWDWLMPVALRIVKKHGIDCISKRYGFSEIYWEVVKAIKFIKNHNETKKEL